MDAETIFVLCLIIGSAAVYVIAIMGSVDALSQPRAAWELAGFRRIRWVWQALGVLLLPAALVYSGLYFVRVRPRLVAASRDLAVARGVARVQLPFAVSAHDPWTDTIKIRVPLSVAVSLPLAVVLADGVGLTLISGFSGDQGPFFWQQLIVWGAGGLLIALVTAAFGVTLTPHDLVMRGLVRRHLAWSDVVAVTQESTLGSRYVRLWTRTGRRRRLRAPFTTFGIGRRRFDADFVLLEQWWRAHARARDSRD